MTTKAEMPALTAGDLRGVGSAVVAGNTGTSRSGPENVRPQRREGCCRNVRLRLTLGEGDGT
jgi:hypothetical protein